MTISCFGHRNIFCGIQEAEDIVSLKETFRRLLECLIKGNDQTIILTGRRGEFDNLCANVIRTIKEKDKSVKLVLVEPYFSDSLNKYKEYYEHMYDSIIIPDELSEAHPKKAISLRNEWMVRQSDCIVSYVNRKSGGAYRAVDYSKKLNKTIYNLGEIEFE